MGWVVKRIKGAKGKEIERFTAYYRDVKGRVRSAGTFSEEAKAERAYQRAEDKIAEGRGDLSRGRQRFHKYVVEEWLPNHSMELRTRENYSYYLDALILPWFNKMRMIEILPSDVRGFATDLAAKGCSADVIGMCLTILGAIFTTAFREVLHLHPVRGVKKPTIPKRQPCIITPEQYDKFYPQIGANLVQRLHEAGVSADVTEQIQETMQLLVDTDTETGVRWGELTELRPRDFDFDTRKITVSRVVVEISPKHSPTGARFVVKTYPKDGEWRIVGIGPDLCDRIKAHIKKHCIGDDDLLFAMPDLPQVSTRRTLPAPETLGRTEPTASGRTYRHGTTSAYSAGKCRCQYCRAAYADYRAKRRANGKDQPRKRRTVDTDGHIPRWWFRSNIWQPALDAAGIKKITTRDLRAIHASWSLAGGADIVVVKERLGHGSLLTTQKYVGTLPTPDDPAVDAFARIRRRSSAPSTTAGS